uniref:Protein GOLM2 n=1 Tax=Serinus canaria TaxID=9135 RepID=A0A8C9NIR5_SERCA
PGSCRLAQKLKELLMCVQSCGMFMCTVPQESTISAVPAWLEGPRQESQTLPSLLVTCIYPTFSSFQMKLQNNISYQMADIHRLKEQLAELRQEFIRQEDQLHEYKKNNTYLTRRLEYDSLQCGQQIKEMRLQHEENIKKLMDQIAREQKATQKVQSSKDTAVSPSNGDQAIPGAVAEMEDKDIVKNEEPSEHGANGKEKIKPGGDAGMPEIEDNDPAKAEDTPTAPKSEGHQPVINLPTEQPHAPNLAPGLPSDSDGNADIAKQIPPNALQHLNFEENVETQKEHKVEPDQIKIPKSRVSDLQKIKQNDEERDLQNDLGDYSKSRLSEGVL